MIPTKHLRITLFLACVSLMTAHAIADVVETRNGARIVGKLTKIEDGKVFVATDFAGDLTIKQSEVTGITTDGPVVMRLSSGTTLQGTMVADGGTLRISGPDGQLATKVDKVAATWAPGGEDPLIVALRRHWSYEASVDIAGKTGNSEQLGTSAGLRAKLKTPQDTLQFYAAYNRQVANGVTSSDQFKAGIDYQDNFAGKMSWYARDEGGFDRVKDIDLYNIAAVGLGYDFIKEPKHLFTGRAGLAYRYESYGNPARANLSTAGLDLGINHEWEFATSKLVNRLSYVPSFEDFSNFLLTHESFYEVPLADPAWKLRIGVSNDYSSKPGPGLERLDTSYFTRLVLNWR